MKSDDHGNGDGILCDILNKWKNNPNPRTVRMAFKKTVTVYRFQGCRYCFLVIKYLLGNVFSLLLAIGQKSVD
jgi:hypothetical protein